MAVRGTRRPVPLRLEDATMTGEEFRRGGPPAYRVDRRLPGTSGAVSRGVAGEAGRHPRTCSRPRPPSGRAFRRHPSRRGASHPARHHALAVAELLRLLSRRTIPARRSWASCSRPASACRGCFGPPARRARNWKPTCWIGWSDLLGLPQHFKSTVHGRRRDPGQCLVGRPVRDSRRPRAYHRRPEQSRRRRRFPGSLRVFADPFLRGESGPRSLVWAAKISA